MAYFASNVEVLYGGARELILFEGADPRSEGANSM